MSDLFLNNLDKPGAITTITETSSESIDDAIDDAVGASNKGNLKYPLEQSERYHASIKFVVHKIVPPLLSDENQKALAEKLNGNQEMRELSAKAREINAIPDDKYDPKNYGDRSKEEVTRDLAIQNEAIRNKLQAESGFKYNDRKEEPTGEVIKLYLPVGFQQNDTFNIATPELGQIGAAAAAGVSGGKGILASAGGALAKGASTLIDFVSGGLAGDAALLAAAQMAAKTPVVGTELGQAAQISAAVTVNPNVRSAFRGVAIREFTFSFKLISRSAAEAKMIEDIITTFRETAYPESIEGGGISVGYKYPNIYDISIMFEKGDVKKRIGSKMRKCYLKSIAVNYNASSMSFHPDGNPVEVDLSLNFIEDQTLSRKDIKEGF